MKIIKKVPVKIGDVITAYPWPFGKLIIDKGWNEVHVSEGLAKLEIDITDPLMEDDGYRQILILELMLLAERKIKEISSVSLIDKVLGWRKIVQLGYSKELHWYHWLRLQRFSGKRLDFEIWLEAASMAAFWHGRDSWSEQNLRETIDNLEYDESFESRARKFLDAIKDIDEENSHIAVEKYLEIVKD